MKIKFKYIIFSIFIINIIFAFDAKADDYIDSLQKELKKAKQDTTKVNLMNDLAWEMQSYDINKAIEYGEQALNLSKTINYNKGLGDAYIILGIFYQSTDNYSKAKDYLQKSLTIREELGDKKGVASCYNNIAQLYHNNGAYRRALEFYNKALEQYQQLNDKNRVAGMYNNIGAIYVDMSDYAQATEFILKALKIKQELSDNMGIANCYINLGNINFDQKLFNKSREYYLKALKIFETLDNKEGLALVYNNLGNGFKKQEKNDTALEMYSKSLKLSEQINDLIGQSESLNNIGAIYFQQNKYFKALNVFKKSIEINEKLENKQGKASGLVNIGDCYMKLNNFSEALMYYHNSLFIAESINDKLLKSKIYFSIADIYQNSGNFQKAYEFNKMYSLIKDSIFTETNSKSITEMQTRYDTEAKEAENELLKKENTVKELQYKDEKNKRILYAGGFLSLLVILAFIVYSLISKNKANKLLQKQNIEIANQKKEIEHQRDHLRLLNNELEQQKEEITAQRDEIENKNIVLRDAKEIIEEKNEHIMSSIRYAQRIQEAILPYEDKISQYLKDFFVIYKPKDIVSGDFYWFNAIENKVFIALVDCTGHGVPGAFMSMIGNTLLNQIINERKIFEPDLILNNLHIDIRSALKQENESSHPSDGMDVCMCVFDFSQNTLSYAGAKRSLYYVQNGELIEIKGDPKSIGGFQREENRTFTSNNVSIECNNVFYLVSDGYADQMDTLGKKIGTKILKQIFTKISCLPMKEQKEFLLDFFDKHKKYEDQIDDVTLIGIKIC